jgi:hypothetical protein
LSTPILLGALLLAPAPARACPGCRLGREVRAAAVSDGFWGNLAAAGLPLAVVVATAGLLERVRR